MPETKKPYIRRTTLQLGSGTPVPLVARPPFAAIEPQPSAPLQLNAAERQTAKSGIIRDFVTAPCEARENHRNYLAALVERAGELAKEIAAQARPPEPQPTTRAGVLSKALYNLGMACEIDEPATWIKVPDREKEHIFTVRFRGRTLRVSLRDSILESADAVSEAMGAIMLHDLPAADVPGQRHPSPYSELEIAEQELDRRNLLYDGVDPDKNHRFVYLSEGAETVFRVPPELVGDGLADHLEERVLGWHMDAAAQGRPVPIPAKVLEAHAERLEQQHYPEGMSAEAHRVAIVLDYLRRITPFPAQELVPEQYRAAFVTLREQAVFKRVVKTEAQMSVLWDAVDELDHPALAQVKLEYEEHARAHGPLDKAGQERFVAERMQASPSDGICEAALGNIVAAYGALTGDPFYESAPKDVLAQNHALFMHAIRTQIAALFKEGYVFVEE